MSINLFEALSTNKVHMLLDEIEHKVNRLFVNRHQYPIWPLGNGPYDEYEHEMHDEIRHTYYQTTKLLIFVLKELKTL